MISFRRFLKANISLTVIVAAALLLELTTAVMYYAAQNIIHQTMMQLTDREMDAIYLSILNKLTEVEITVENTSWVVSGDLQQAEWMFPTTRQMVEHNPSILGCGITFVPGYYPEKGRWFEPYSVRKTDGTIETLQLGSATHDYTKAEFYTVPMATGVGHWCEPYHDKEGAKTIVTTYGVPVRDDKGDIVAVIGADISLDWLDEIVEEDKIYSSTQRFIVSRAGHLLAGRDNAVYKMVRALIPDSGDNEGDIVEKDEHGDEHHIFYQQIGGKTDWMLVSVMDDDEVFEKLRRIRVILLLPVMIGLLFVGIVVYRSSRNIERLRKINAEKDRISGELRVANQIQQSMLPRHHLHLDDVDICGLLIPAREVGGDLFDYFIRDEKLFFCIGDVSGKGAPSAMVMGVIHSLFRAFSAHENNPAHIMQAINEASCRGNESNMFVTLFVGVLDLPTGHLRYCDAGHDAPKVMGDGSWYTVYCDPHLPVGVFDDVKYDVQEAQMMPGNTLFLYTDGLTEARNGSRKLFGMERLKAVLATCADMQPEEIQETIITAVHEFTGDAEQSDDLTMLVIRYTPQKFESTLTETLILKNDIQEVKRFSSFMKSVIEKLNIEKSFARQLRLAVEEAVVNVIEYAYPAGTEGDIEIRMMSDSHVFKVMIIDNGVAFDPTTKEKTDTTLPAEDRQMGGLGLLLIRELMDTINYERIKGQNILTLIKNL